MHLIIDIRSRHIEDIYTIRYAKNWAKKWKKFSPSDACTFLILEEQESPEGEAFLRVKNTSWFSAKKSLKPANNNDILRVINFSRYAPYDPMIPTLTHIYDMGRYFYESEVNVNILRRKEREYEIKKIVHNSSHMIVPNFFTGNELVELWNVDESKIDIFPYLPMEPINKITIDPEISRLLANPYFLYDGTYWLESNLETTLLYFSKYRENGGTFHFILHGNTGKNLSVITEIIKKYHLEKVVHLTGCLDIGTHEALYENAKAWVACVSYYTGKTHVALAASKNLPMIVSDIPAFSLYPNAIKIHPNYPETLDSIFYHLEHGEKFDLPEAMQIDEKIIFEHYKKIFSKNHFLKK